MFPCDVFAWPCFALETKGHGNLHRYGERAACRFAKEMLTETLLDFDVRLVKFGCLNLLSLKFSRLRGEIFYVYSLYFNEWMHVISQLNICCFSFFFCIRLELIQGKPISEWPNCWIYGPLRLILDYIYIWQQNNCWNCISIYFLEISIKIITYCNRNFEKKQL